MDLPDLTGVSPEARRRLAAGEDPQTVLTADAEQQAGVRPGLVDAILRKGENSAWNATSPKGARGVAQFMPATAQALGVDPDNPVSSIYGAARLTRQNLDRFGGDEPMAVAAYNAGAPAVDHHGGVPPYAETQAYVGRVLGPGAPAAAPAAGDLPDVSHLTPQQLARLAKGDTSVLQEAEAEAAPGGQPAPSPTAADRQAIDPAGQPGDKGLPPGVYEDPRDPRVKRNPDGTVYGIGDFAPDPSANANEITIGGSTDKESIEAFLQRHPDLRGAPPIQHAMEDARKDIGQVAKTDTDKALGKLWSGWTLGAGDELSARVAALKVGLGNLTGHGPGYGMEDAYRAQADALRASEKGFDEAHPWESAGLSMLGAAVNPLSIVGGEYVAGAKALPAIMGRSALVGAGTGALDGYWSNNGSVADRLLAGAGGAVTGGALGAALPVGLEGVRRGMSAASETAQRILGAFGREGAEPSAAAVAKATPQAETYVQGLVDRAKPDALNNPELEAAGGTAAEALGRPAMTQLGAVARRDGQTGDLVESMMRLRGQALPADMVDDFHGITGLDPAAMHGDHVQQAANLRDKAAPLYDYAFRDPRGLTSTKLDDLARRPLVKQAQQRALSIARNEGREPDGLSIVDVEAPPLPPPEAMTGGDQPSFMDTLRTVRSGKVPNAKQGLSLLQYMSRNGGVRDEGGELTALDADKWHRGKPGFAKLIQPSADTLEGWGQRAWEAGYFPDLMQAPDEQGMLSAIYREMAGKPRFAIEPDARTSATRGAADAMEEHLSRLGIDPAKAGDDEIAEALNPIEGGRHPYAPPDMEPAYTQAPTLRSWDDVKRGLDDIVESHRDRTTRKIIYTNESRAAIETVKQLRNELTRLRPEYGEALAAGGEPLRLEQAFNEAKGLARNTVPERVFNERWNGYSVSQQDGARAGFLNGVYEDMRAGRLKIRDMQSPAFNSKLETMFGPERAKALSTRLQARAVLARTGARISPGNGSPTYEFGGADADREQMLAAAKGAAKDAANQNYAGAAVRLLTAPVVGAYRGAQVPLDRASRDVVGRLLSMRPSELDAALAAAKARVAARGRRPAYRAPARMVGANVAGFLGSRPFAGQ